MFTFETTDQKEARRFRIAQFNGRIATARCAGATVTGHCLLHPGKEIDAPQPHGSSRSFPKLPRTAARPPAGVPRPDPCGRTLLKLWKL